jgi:hypothetical protein
MGKNKHLAHRQDQGSLSEEAEEDMVMFHGRSSYYWRQLFIVSVHSKYKLCKSLIFVKQKDLKK